MVKTGLKLSVFIINNNPVYKKKGGFWIYAVVVTIFAVIIIISLAIVNEKITNKIKK
jgi:hypothetical protein